MDINEIDLTQSDSEDSVENPEHCPNCNNKMVIMVQQLERVMEARGQKPSVGNKRALDEKTDGAKKLKTDTPPSPREDSDDSLPPRGIMGLLVERPMVSTADSDSESEYMTTSEDNDSEKAEDVKTDDDKTEDAAVEKDGDGEKGTITDDPNPSITQKGVEEIVDKETDIPKPSKAIPLDDNSPSTGEDTDSLIEKPLVISMDSEAGLDASATISKENGLEKTEDVEANGAKIENVAAEMTGEPMKPVDKEDAETVVTANIIAINVQGYVSFVYFVFV